MKKFLVVLVLVATMVCVAPSAFAADWVEVYGDSSFNIFFDRETVKYTGEKILAWEQWFCFNNKARQAYAKTFGYKKLVRYTLCYSEYCLEDRTCRMLRATDYDDNFDMLGQRNRPEPINYIAPGTLADYLLNNYKKILGI